MTGSARWRGAMYPGLAAASTVTASGWVVAAAVAHRGPGFTWTTQGRGFLLNPVGVGLVAGLVGAAAWALRPSSPVGPLLTVTGLLWLAQLAPLAGGRLALTVGLLALGAYGAPLVHVALACPDVGRRGGLDRALLGGVYGFTAVHSLLNAMFAPADGARSSLLQIGGGDAHVLDVAGPIVVVPLLADLLVLVVVLARWRSALPATRRTTGLVVLSAALTVAYLAVSGPLLHLDGPASGIVLMLIPLGLLGAVTWSRSRRLSVDDLVAGLGEDSAEDRETLRQVLAGALSDPSLVLLAHNPAAPGEIDLAVAARDWPTRHVSALTRRGRTVGALVLDPGVLAEHRRVQAVTAAAALILDNGLLVAELADQLKEVSASRSRIVAAGDAQRRRLEHDLHDGAQQRLVSVALLMQMARSELATVTVTSDGAAVPFREARALLHDAATELSAALAQLRELAHGLAPAILSEYGLGAALEDMTAHVPVPVQLLAAPAQRLDPALESSSYYLICEAVTNAVKHAHATLITINVTLGPAGLQLQVIDDGCGGADPHGFGMVSMSDRAAAVGGHLTVTSPPGGGTHIHASYPPAAPRRRSPP